MNRPLAPALWCRWCGHSPGSAPKLLSLTLSQQGTGEESSWHLAGTESQGLCQLAVRKPVPPNKAAGVRTVQPNKASLLPAAQALPGDQSDVNDLDVSPLVWVAQSWRAKGKRRWSGYVSPPQPAGSQCPGLRWQSLDSRVFQHSGRFCSGSGGVHHAGTDITSRSDLPPI